ncbi:hypothetical protein AHAS_Ahas06G0004400 [Arachis hypogaea]
MELCFVVYGFSCYSQRGSLGCCRDLSSVSVTITITITMSSDSIPENENLILLGCGSVSIDLLATVAAYPKPDEKIRSTSFKVEGGGNAANALTCAARLGLKPRLISKVADDTHGRAIIDELQADGVDTSFIVVSEEGTSPFTYIIVDSQTKSRTCIHTPGFPKLMPAELPESTLFSALSGAGIVFLDGRLHETALVVAHEAVRKNIPILMDAERLREGLDDLIQLADYLTCATRFPQVWAGATTIPKALVSMVLRLPKVKFVIVTLGKDGCIMLERSVDEGASREEADVDILLESLEMKRNRSTYMPTCISSPVTKLQAEGIGTVCGRLYVGTAENIPPSELIDTTGAGDAFAGAVLYALSANFSRENMLCFAATVVSSLCNGCDDSLTAGQQVITYVSSPSFAADLSVQAYNADDLGNVCIFGELVAAMRVALILDGASTFMEVRYRDPLAKVIGDDGSNSEPLIISDDIDGEEDTTCVGRSQAQSSSQTQQYLPHFSNLDLEAMNQLAFSDQHSWRRPDMLGPDEFHSLLCISKLHINRPPPICFRCKTCKSSNPRTAYVDFQSSIPRTIYVYFLKALLSINCFSV